MTPATVARIVVIVAVAGYVGWMQSVNPTPIALPGLLTVPLWLVVVLVALATFLATWIPSWWASLRRRRHVRRLEERIAELESHLPSYDSGRGAPVIPDRAGEPPTSRTP